MRLAFGTFNGVADPENYRLDIDFILPRLRADPSAAFAAEVDGELVGSNFAACWGSFGFFGPLTVHPDFWNKGVGQQLMQPIMKCFDRWGTRMEGLFTFAHSIKHVALYQKFGFSARFLTAVLSKEVRLTSGETLWSKYSDIPQNERGAILGACNRLTETIYPGLSLEREIRAVDAQGLGETVLVWSDRELAGFAVCHCGPGTEAGEDRCYVKFAASRPGANAAPDFGLLLHACEAYAASREVKYIDAGVNLARHEAYRHLLDEGFRTLYQGVAMHRPNDAGFSTPGVYVIDDWR